MNLADPFLALIGHGTTGNDGIEPGIHLRWQFRSELGFPLGGFVLYRREESSRGQPICIDFQGMQSGDRTTEFTVGRVPSRLTFSNLGAPLHIETRSWTDEPFQAADPVHLPRIDPGRRAAGRRRLRVLSVPDARFSINLPESVYRVTLHVEFKPGPFAISQIYVRGYADGTEVARTGARSRVAAIRSTEIMI